MRVPIELYQQPIQLCLEQLINAQSFSEGETALEYLYGEYQRIISEIKAAEEASGASLQQQQENSAQAIIIIFKELFTHYDDASFLARLILDQCTSNTDIHWLIDVLFEHPDKDFIATITIALEALNQCFYESFETLFNKTLKKNERFMSRWMEVISQKQTKRPLVTLYEEFYEILLINLQALEITVLPTEAHCSAINNIVTGDLDYIETTDKVSKIQPGKQLRQFDTLLDCKVYLVRLGIVNFLSCPESLHYLLVMRTSAQESFSLMRFCFELAKKDINEASAAIKKNINKTEKNISKDFKLISTDIESYFEFELDHEMLLSMTTEFSLFTSVFCGIGFRENPFLQMYICLFQLMCDNNIDAADIITKSIINFIDRLPKKDSRKLIGIIDILSKNIDQQLVPSIRSNLEAYAPLNLPKEFYISPLLHTLFQRNNEKATMTLLLGNFMPTSPNSSPEVVANTVSPVAPYLSIQPPEASTPKSLVHFFNRLIKIFLFLPIEKFRTHYDFVLKPFLEENLLDFPETQNTNITHSICSNYFIFIHTLEEDKLSYVIEHSQNLLQRVTETLWSDYCVDAYSKTGILFKTLALWMLCDLLNEERKKYLACEPNDALKALQDFIKSDIIKGKLSQKFEPLFNTHSDGEDIVQRLVTGCVHHLLAEIENEFSEKLEAISETHQTTDKILLRASKGGLEQVVFSYNHFYRLMKRQNLLTENIESILLPLFIFGVITEHCQNAPDTAVANINQLFDHFTDLNEQLMVLEECSAHELSIIDAILPYRSLLTNLLIQGAKDEVLLILIERISCENLFLLSKNLNSETGLLEGDEILWSASEQVVQRYLEKILNPQGTTINQILQSYAAKAAESEAFTTKTEMFPFKSKTSTGLDPWTLLCGSDTVFAVFIAMCGEEYLSKLALTPITQAKMPEYTGRKSLVLLPLEIVASADKTDRLFTLASYLEIPEMSYEVLTILKQNLRSDFQARKAEAPTPLISTDLETVFSFKDYSVIALLDLIFFSEILADESVFFSAVIKKISMTLSDSELVENHVNLAHGELSQLLEPSVWLNEIFSKTLKLEQHVVENLIPVFIHLFLKFNNPVQFTNFIKLLLNSGYSQFSEIIPSEYLIPILFDWLPNGEMYFAKLDKYNPEIQRIIQKKFMLTENTSLSLAIESNEQHSDGVIQTLNFHAGFLCFSCNQALPEAGTANAAYKMIEVSLSMILESFKEVCLTKVKDTFAKYSQRTMNRISWFTPQDNSLSFRVAVSDLETLLYDPSSGLYRLILLLKLAYKFSEQKEKLGELRETWSKQGQWNHTEMVESYSDEINDLFHALAKAWEKLIKFILNDSLLSNDKFSRLENTIELAGVRLESRLESLITQCITLLLIGPLQEEQDYIQEKLKKLRDFIAELEGLEKKLCSFDVKYSKHHSRTISSINTIIKRLELQKTATNRAIDGVNAGGANAVKKEVRSSLKVPKNKVKSLIKTCNKVISDSRNLYKNFSDAADKVKNQVPKKPSRATQKQNDASTPKSEEASITAPVAAGASSDVIQTIKRVGLEFINKGKEEDFSGCHAILFSRKKSYDRPLDSLEDWLNCLRQLQQERINNTNAVFAKFSVCVRIFRILEQTPDSLQSNNPINTTILDSKVSDLLLHYFHFILYPKLLPKLQQQMVTATELTDTNFDVFINLLISDGEKSLEGSQFLLALIQIKENETTEKKCCYVSVFQELCEIVRNTQIKDYLTLMGLFLLLNEVYLRGLKQLVTTIDDTFEASASVRNFAKCQSKFPQFIHPFMSSLNFLRNIFCHSTGFFNFKKATQWHAKKLAQVLASQTTKNHRVTVPLFNYSPEQIAILLEYQQQQRSQDTETLESYDHCQAYLVTTQQGFSSVVKGLNNNFFKVSRNYILILDISTEGACVLWKIEASELNEIEVYKINCADEDIQTSVQLDDLNAQLSESLKCTININHEYYELEGMLPGGFDLGLQRMFHEMFPSDRFYYYLEQTPELMRDIQHDVFRMAYQYRFTNKDAHEAGPSSLSLN